MNFEGVEDGSLVERTAHLFCRKIEQFGKRCILWLQQDQESRIVLQDEQDNSRNPRPNRTLFPRTRAIFFIKFLIKRFQYYQRLITTVHF